jgi:hypothetical protein
MQPGISSFTTLARATVTTAFFFMYVTMIHCSPRNCWEDGFRLSPTSFEKADSMSAPECFHELVKPSPQSTTTTNVGDEKLFPRQNNRIKASERPLDANNKTMSMGSNIRELNKTESIHPQAEVLMMKEGGNETMKLLERDNKSQPNYKSPSTAKQLQLFGSNETSEHAQIYPRKVKPSMAERRVEKGRITCDLGEGISYQKGPTHKRWVSRKRIEEMVRGRDPIANVQVYPNRRNAKVRLTADSSALKRLFPLFVFAVNASIGAFVGTMRLVAPL